MTISRGLSHFIVYCIGFAAGMGVYRYAIAPNDLRQQVDQFARSTGAPTQSMPNAPQWQIEVTSDGGDLTCSKAKPYKYVITEVGMIKGHLYTRNVFACLPVEATSEQVVAALSQVEGINVTKPSNEVAPISIIGVSPVLTPPHT